MRPPPACQPAPTPAAAADPPTRPAEAAAVALTPERAPSALRRFYYGWVMLPIATLALIATSPAQTFGVSAFNEPMRQALGLSHSQLTGAYMAGTFLASLPMSWVGAIMDRFGLRRTMTVVVLLFGAACILSSQARGLFTIFLAFLCLRMLGQGALGLLSGNTLPFWFERRLGTVEGFRHMGMAGAIAVVPALNLWLVDAFGWRGAYIILGLGVWAVMLPLMLLFRDRPEDVGQTIDNEPSPDPADAHAASITPGLNASFTLAQACRTRALWIAVAATALWALSNTAVLFNIVPLFLERGLTELDAARLFTVFAISLAVMQLAGGMLADRLPLNRLLAVAVLGMSAAMGLIYSIQSAALVPIVGITMGVSQGLLTASTGPLWPRYYGRAHLGRIRGTLATIMVAASSVGPFLLGVCVDLTGGYGPVLAAFSLVALPLAGLALFATPPTMPPCDDDCVELDTPPEAAM